VSKRDKLIKKILIGKSNVSTNDAIKILEMLGFRASKADGSHLTFRKQGSKSVTIILTQNPIKSYLLDKLRDVLNNEGYNNDN